MSLFRLATVCGLAAASLLAQPRPEERSETVGFLHNPGQREFSEDRLRQLQLPAGFRASVFARDLQNARFMAVSESGAVYLTRREQGDVLFLRDTNGDGVADERRTVASNLPYVHGITIARGQLYLVTTREVYVAPLDREGEQLALRAIIRDLPDGGQHPNRTIAVGPDGLLYITVGSTCNACPESNPENATIVRANLDGTNRTIFARGLRNTIGFGWRPGTQELFGMDMGSDWRGDDIAPDELNRIEQGRDYGWPFCYAEQRVDRWIAQAPRGTTREEYCARTVPSALTYQAHSSPVGMVFYDGAQFPAEYRGDALIAFRGSWNRFFPVGYKLVRLRFQGGQPSGFEDFATGWLTEGGSGYFGRPTGLAIARDGSLLMTDDTNGMIYRIAFVGTQR